MADRISRSTHRTRPRKGTRSLSATSVGSKLRAKSMLSFRGKHGTTAYQKVKEQEEIEMMDLAELDL